MAPGKDYYATLGVLSDAEDIVIRAAYRALSQRYHPDKVSEGERADAHLRMTALNEAFDVLGDAERRRLYDIQRAGSGPEPAFEEQLKASAFEQAMTGMEDRWKVALSIYPELDGIRQRLKKVSHELAFAYTVSLLEGRHFDALESLAAHLEKGFFEVRFGSNPTIIAFARGLVMGGEREAALALNEIVSVVGSKADPQRIIDKIRARFPTPGTNRAATYPPAALSTLQKLQEKVREYRYVDDAIELAAAIGLEAKVVAGNLFSATYVSVKTPKESLRFPNQVAFVDWMIETYC